jgi:hypothetical protein
MTNDSRARQRRKVMKYDAGSSAALPENFENMGRA